MIIDGRGRLVWYLPVPSGQVAENLQVQSYQGRPVLVWWRGRVPPTLGVGFGQDEIYDSSYRRIATIKGGNGYHADLHDIQLTPQGSAFITAYTLVDADLSSLGGSRHGALQDAMVQEIDVPTGLVMFEWHAYGHVDLHDSYARISRSGPPWDFFHINSISLDPWGDGNFIVSSRNTWAAYEIDHVTGGVLWRLGGRRSSFKMGAGTGTAYQHDVRWQADHTLTIFDNGAVPKAHTQSRVVRERIDFKHRTVSLVSRYVRVPGLLSGSQGNAQLLAGGSFFVGWGESPFFTEFNAAGQSLFDGRLPAPGQSYRAYRFPWSASPATAPVDRGEGECHGGHRLRQLERSHRGERLARVRGPHPRDAEPRGQRAGERIRDGHRRARWPGQLRRSGARRRRERARDIRRRSPLRPEPSRAPH